MLLDQALGSGSPMPIPFVVTPTGGSLRTVRAECWRATAHGPGQAIFRMRLDEGGSAARFLALSETIEKLNREIRHRREIEARLQDAVERSVVANRLKDELLAHMSHDLRTPLNAIIGFSEFLQGEPYGPLQEKYREYVAGIRRSGDELLAFVERTLELAGQHHALRQDVAQELVDLSACLDGVRAVLQPLAERKQLEFMVPDDMRLPRLRADQALIKQILINLLGTAVESTPSGGSVGVEGAWAPDGGYKLRIIDTGCGIPDRDVDALTRPAAGLRPAYIASERNSGLGLALVRSAADALGATLSWDSAPETGTCVSIHFPREAINLPATQG